MKILMLITAMGLGGAETHVLTLANELAGRGHTVYVASRGGALEEQLDPGVERVRIGASLSPRGFSSDERLLLRLCREAGIGVIHGHTRAVNLLGDRLSRKSGIPFVSTVHWTFSTRQPKKALSRWGARQLAVSPDIRAYLLEQYAVAPDLAACTVNGIDTRLFRPAEKKKKALLHISRLDRGREECAALLIGLAPRLVKTGLYESLDIVGDGDRRFALMQEAEVANRRIGFDFIRLHGGRTDTHRFLSEAAYFVGVSRAALEAMAAECRVILCGNEGYGGIFSPEEGERHQNSNFCCRGMPPPTAEALYKDLLSLPSTDGGRENRAYIKRHYTACRMADDAEKMYASLPPSPEKRKKATLCGYYGYKNLGDEAMLSVLCDRLTAEGYAVDVLAGSRRREKGLFPHRVLPRFFLPSVLLSLLSSDVFILGGGNLLQNESSNRSLLYYASLARFAKLFGKPIWLQSVGIGAYSGNFAKKTVQRILDECEQAVFRTSKDLAKARALSDNPRFFLSPDAALFYPFDRFPPKRQARSCVALSVKSGEIVPPSVLFALEKEGYELFFLVMNPRDLPAAKAAADGRRIYVPHSVGEALSLLGGASLSIGERLHFAIFSFGLGVPHLCLDASEKAMDFYKEVTQAARFAGYPSAEGILEKGEGGDTPEALLEKAMALLSFKGRPKKAAALIKAFHLFR